MWSMNVSPQNVWQRLKKKSSPLLCRICGKPVAIETCKTDDGGKAVHEECYVLRLTPEQRITDGHQT
jgi:hypothetical protein